MACACAPTSPTCRPARPTNIRTGRWSIRRNGCRTATSVIRVDSRGAGRSPGVIDIWSLREAQDLAQCVDWAGVQPWSNGKVGLNGISYYAENQWQAAALQPKHLAAICTVGGRRRFLPRHGAPRRHLLPRLRAGLVEGAGLHRAERARHARLQEPHERRLGVGAGDALGRTARQKSPRLLRRLHLAQARHRRILAVAHAGLEQSEGAAALDRQLGRARPASARQFRRLRALRVGEEMARSARHRALDALLYELRPRPAEAVLRPLPQRRRRPAGPSSRRCNCRCAIPARNSSSGTRTNGRSSARNGPSFTSIRPT